MNLTKIIRFLILIILLTLIFIGVNVFFEQNDTDTYNIEKLKAIPLNQVRQKMRDSNTGEYEDISNHIVKDASLGPVKFTKLPPKGSSIDWERDFANNRSKNFELHSWDMLEDALVEYSHTKNQKLLETVLNISLDWILHNKTELKNNSQKNFAWYDMAVGKRIYRLSYILDQSIKQNIGTYEQHATLWSSLLDHFQYLKDDGNIVFHNNHGLYQAIGQKVAARRFVSVSEDFSTISREAAKRLQLMVSLHFTEEGIHKEHSPDYHRMVYSSLIRLQRDEILNDAATSEVIKKAGDALWWMIKPNMVLAEFGDTEYQIIEQNNEIYFSEASPYLLHYISGGNEGHLPNEPIAVFNNSGLAIVKSGNSYLAQQSSFHSRTHKHADDLSFIWQEKGRDILIDSGKFGYVGRTVPGSKEYEEGFYYSNPKRQYVEKTRAHNAVEIDEKDNLRKDRKPYGSAIVDSGKLYKNVYFVKSQVQQFNTINQERLLVYQPGSWLFIIDRLEDTNGSRHKYKQWFQFAPTIEPKETTGHIKMNVGKSELFMRSLTSGVEGQGPIKGQTKPHLQGWYSKKPGSIEPINSFAYSVNNKSSADFVTLFSFDTDIQLKDLSTQLNREGEGMVSWNQKSKRYKIILSDEGIELTVK